MVNIRKLWVIAGVCITLAAPLLIHHFSHSDIEQEQSLCPFKLLTGFPCPGCGITKSLIFLYQGDLVKSFSYHLLGPLFFIACLILLLLMIAELLTSKVYFRKYLYNKQLAYWMGGLLAVYHTIRLVVFVSTHDLASILRESVWM